MYLEQLGEQVLNDNKLSYLIGHVRFSLQDKYLIVRPLDTIADKAIGSRETLRFDISKYMRI